LRVPPGRRPERGTGPKAYYVPPFNPPRKTNYGKGLLDDPRIPLGYLRYLFGPAILDVLRRLEEELARAQVRGHSLEGPQTPRARPPTQVHAAHLKPALVAGVPAAQAAPRASRLPHLVLGHHLDDGGLHMRKTQVIRNKNT